MKLGWEIFQQEIPDKTTREVEFVRKNIAKSRRDIALSLIKVSV